MSLVQYQYRPCPNHLYPLPTNYQIDIQLIANMGTHGNVKLQSYNGRLRIVLPLHVKPKKRYLSLFLADNPQNRLFAEQKVTQIKLDILSNHFDPTLEKYRPQWELDFVDVDSDGQGITGDVLQEMSVQAIFHHFCANNEKEWEVKTIAQYATFMRHLERMPEYYSQDALSVKQWIVSNLSRDTGKRLIVRINAAYNWAIKEELATTNPFKGMAVSMPRPVASEAVEPFSAIERDYIIDAFGSHPVYFKYAPLVKFLFWTGARHEEAIGLRWRSVKPEYVEFCEVTTYCGGKLIHRPTTKTGKTRRFKLNARLSELLKSIKPAEVVGEEFVFLLPTGEQINHNHFFRAWKGYGNYKGIIPTLVAEGKVKIYRNPYTTRHTWASLALTAGKMSISEIAYVLGNSSLTCEKLYVRPFHNLNVPEF